MVDGVKVAPRLGFADRVGERASQVKFVTLLLSLIALPFYVLGVVVAIVWLAARWCYAAWLEGFADVAKKPEQVAADVG